MERDILKALERLARAVETGGIGGGGGGGSAGGSGGGGGSGSRTNRRAAEENDRVTESLRRRAAAQDSVTPGLDRIIGGTEDYVDAEREANRERERAWKNLRDQIDGVTSLSEAYDLGKRAVKLYLEQHKKLGRAVAGATAALKGAAAGAKLTAAAFKGIFSIGGSLIGMFADIGAAIISIPFKFFNHVFSKAKQLMSGGTEIAQAYEDVRKVFGNTGSGLGKSVIDLGKNLTKGVITPGLSARRVFGDLSEAINYANEVASASPEAFQAVSDQFSGRNGLEILAMAKGLGIANEELVGFMDSAIATGQPVESMLTEVTKYAKGMGDAFGLNSKMISRSMAKAAKDVKHFANSSVKEIAQATVYAQKLGVSLESITGILDAFNTFESAAENVSKLSQAFGVNLDAMKLLEAKTPDEALDQVKQAFAAAGKSADQMNRQELQLIASTVGMDEATVRKTLSMKNAGASMQNIKGVSSSLEKQTMDTSQALSRLSKDIEKMVKAGQPPEGDNFFDVFLEGVVEGIDRTGEMKKLFMKTAESIMKVREEGRKLGASIMENFPGFKQFIVGLTTRLQDVPNLFRNIRISFEVFMKGLENGKSSFSSLMNMLKGDLVGFMGGDNSEMAKGLRRMWEATKRIFAEGINWLTDQLKSAILAALDFLRNDPNKAAGGLLGDAAKEVAPITDALKRMWEELKDPIIDLLIEAASAFLKALWEGFNKLPWQARWATYALAFGPSIVGALGNALLSQGAQALLSKGFGKAAETALTGYEPAAARAPGLLARAGTAVAGLAAPTSVGGVAIAGGTAAVAATAAAAAAAVGGLYLAYDQASSLSKELAEHENQRNAIVEANKGMTEKTTQEYQKQKDELKKQVSVMREKHKLGMMTAEELAKEEKRAKAAQAENTTGALSKQTGMLRGFTNAVTDELGSGKRSQEQLTKSLDEMFAKATENASSGIEGAASNAAEYYDQALGQVMNQLVESGAMNDTIRNGQWGGYMKGVIAGVENANEDQLKQIAEMSVDALETSDAEWAKSMGMKDINVSAGEATYLKLMAAKLLMEKKAKKEAEGAKDKAEKEKADEAAAAAKKAEEQQLEARQQLLDEIGLDTKWTVETAGIAIDKVEALAKKLKGINVSKTMSDVRAQMDGIDFRVFTDPNKSSQVTQSMIDMKAIIEIFQSLGVIGPSLEAAKVKLEKLTKGTAFQDVEKAFINFQNLFKGDVGIFSRIKSLTDLMKADQEKLNQMPVTTDEYFTSVDEIITRIANGVPPLAQKASESADALTIENGPRDMIFKFAESIVGIMDKFSDIDTSVGKTKPLMEKITKSIDDVNAFVPTMIQKIANLETTFKKIPQIRAEDSLTALNNAVGAVNKINTALGNLSLGEKNVMVNLSKAVKGVTVKAFDPIPIKGGTATVNLNVSVYMSATDIESNIVKPSGSKIRAAINEALSGDKKTMGPSGTVTETK